MKNIIIRNTSDSPIYQQLYEQISTQIINGELKPNEVLPSMRVFAKEIRVSIITIKKTWELLERDDLIYTVKGKGSYVKKNSESSLNMKKIESIKEVLSDSINLCKEYNISKEELIEIIDELFTK